MNFYILLLFRINTVKVHRTHNLIFQGFSNIAQINPHPQGLQACKVGSLIVWLEPSNMDVFSSLDNRSQAGFYCLSAGCLIK